MVLFEGLVCVLGVGCGGEGSGFLGVGVRVQGSWEWGVGARVQGSWVWGEDSGFSVQGTHIGGMVGWVPRKRVPNTTRAQTALCLIHPPALELTQIVRWDSSYLTLLAARIWGAGKVEGLKSHSTI